MTNHLYFLSNDIILKDLMYNYYLKDCLYCFRIQYVITCIGWHFVMLKVTGVLTFRKKLTIIVLYKV